MMSPNKLRTSTMMRINSGPGNLEGSSLSIDRPMRLSEIHVAAEYALQHTISDPDLWKSLSSVQEFEVIILHSTKKRIVLLDSISTIDFQFFSFCYFLNFSYSPYCFFFHYLDTLGALIHLSMSIYASSLTKYRLHLFFFFPFCTMSLSCICYFLLDSLSWLESGSASCVAWLLGQRSWHQI